MKKILSIIVLGLLLSGNAYATKFFIGKEIKDNFIYDKNIQISLDGGNWVVIRNNTSLDYSIKQRIVGIGRVENNEIMEMIELYKGDLAGYYIHYINQAILEIVFKDKHDGRKLTNCDKYSECLIRLPIYYELNQNDQQKIIDTVIKFFSKNQ